MAGFSPNLWTVFAFLIQTTMVVTIAVYEFMRSNAAFAQSYTVVLMLGWLVMLYAVITAFVRDATDPGSDDDFMSTLTALTYTMLAPVIASATLWVEAVLALVSCSAGNTGMCVSPFVFVDGLFVAWLLVNVGVHGILLVVLTYWSTMVKIDTKPRPVTAKSTQLTRARGTVLLVTLGLVFTWLAYMAPMFVSKQRQLEFMLTLPIVGAIALAILVATGRRWHTGVWWFAWLAACMFPISLQCILLMLRAYWITWCRVASTHCIYTAYAVDAAMIFANVVVLLLLGATAFAVGQTGRAE